MMSVKYQAKLNRSQKNLETAKGDLDHSALYLFIRELKKIS